MTDKPTVTPLTETQFTWLIERGQPEKQVAALRAALDKEPK